MNVFQYDALFHGSILRKYTNENRSSSLLMTGVPVTAHLLVAFNEKQAFATPELRSFI